MKAKKRAALAAKRARRAAAKAADPKKASRYAQKRARQVRGTFAPTSPFAPTETIEAPQ